MTEKEADQLIELENLRHKNRMKEIKTEIEGKREISNLKFDQQMQLQRIKTAEIKRAFDRKADREFMEKNGYRK